MVPRNARCDGNSIGAFGLATISAICSRVGVFGGVQSPLPCLDKTGALGNGLAVAAVDLVHVLKLGAEAAQAGCVIRF